MSEPPIIPSGQDGSPSGPAAVPPPDAGSYPPYTQYPPYPPYAPFPPYPPFPQPGYPPPGYPPPGYWPPGYRAPGYRRPRKDNTRTVYGIIAAVLAVGIILSIGCGLAYSNYLNLLNHSLTGSLATLTVNELCLDEETQDYSSAYSLLSSNLQQQYSESQFILDSQQHDSTLGTVSTCSQQGPATSVTSTNVTVPVAITRTLTPTPDASGNTPASQASDYSGQVSLVEMASQWKVDQVDSTLNLL